MGPKHWGIRYRAHNGVLRWAVVVAPAQYGPRNPPPPLPLVISPHGRSVRARTNARLWVDLPPYNQLPLSAEATLSCPLHRLDL